MNWCKKYVGRSTLGHKQMFENGVLVVDLVREVPEELKPRKIEIKTNPIKSLAKKAKKMIGVDKKAA